MIWIHATPDVATVQYVRARWNRPAMQVPAKPVSTPYFGSRHRSVAVTVRTEIANPYPAAALSDWHRQSLKPLSQRPLVEIGRWRKQRSPFTGGQNPIFSHVLSPWPGVGGVVATGIEYGTTPPFPSPEDVSRRTLRASAMALRERQPLRDAAERRWASVIIRRPWHLQVTAWTL